MMNRKIVIFAFILMLLPLVLGSTTFFDNQDDSFIMDNIVLPPPITPPTPGGGGGGGTAIECLNDSQCDLGESCFANTCRVDECTSDSDCNDTKTCWMNMCVKLFDMKIIDVQSPINSGEDFEFTYYIKGVAAIHGDVMVRFWLVKDEEIITDGFDTIYMADFDETTETSQLFLPKSVEDGVYNFYTEVSYDSYYARAGRTIEVGEGGILGKLLDISFNLDDAQIEKSDELSAGINFDSFGDIPARLNLTFTIIDSFGEEVYKEEDKIIVATEQFLRWNYDGLDIPNGDYTAVLETAYGENVRDRFTQEFTIGKEFSDFEKFLRKATIPFLIVLGIFIIWLIVYWERKKLKKALIVERKWFRRNRTSIAVIALIIILIWILYCLDKFDIISLPLLKILSDFFRMVILGDNYWIYAVSILAILLLIPIYKILKKYFRSRKVRKTKVEKKRKSPRKVSRRKSANFLVSFFEGVKKKRHSKKLLRAKKRREKEHEKELLLKRKEREKKKERRLAELRKEKRYRERMRFRKTFLNIIKKALRKPVKERGVKRKKVLVKVEPEKHKKKKDLFKVFKKIFSGKPKKVPPVKEVVAVELEEHDSYEPLTEKRKPFAFVGNIFSRKKQERVALEEEAPELQEKPELEVKVFGENILEREEKKEEIIREPAPNFYERIIHNFRERISRMKAERQKSEELRLAEKKVKNIFEARKDDLKESLDNPIGQNVEELDNNRHDEFLDNRSEEKEAQEKAAIKKKRRRILVKVKKHVLSFFAEMKAKRKNRKKERLRQKKERILIEKEKAKIAHAEKLEIEARKKEERKQRDLRRLKLKKERQDKREKMKKVVLSFFAEMKAKRKNRKKERLRQKKERAEKEKNLKIKELAVRRKREKALRLKEVTKKRQERKDAKEKRIEEKEREKRLLKLRKIKEQVIKMEKKESSKISSMGILKKLRFNRRKLKRKKSRIDIKKEKNYSLGDGFKSENQNQIKSFFNEGKRFLKNVFFIKGRNAKLREGIINQMREQYRKENGF